MNEFDRVVGNLDHMCELASQNGTRLDAVTYHKLQTTQNMYGTIFLHLPRELVTLPSSTTSQSISGMPVATATAILPIREKFVFYGPKPSASEAMVKNFRRSARVLCDGENPIQNSSGRQFILSNKHVVQKHLIGSPDVDKIIDSWKDSIAMSCIQELLNSLTNVTVEKVKSIFFDLNPCNITNAIDLFIIGLGQGQQIYISLGGTSDVQRRLRELKRLLSAECITPVFENEQHDMTVFAEIVGIVYLKQLTITFGILV